MRTRFTLLTLAVLPMAAYTGQKEHIYSLYEEHVGLDAPLDRGYGDSNSGQARANGRPRWMSCRPLGWVLVPIGFIGICVGCWQLFSECACLLAWNDFPARRLRLALWLLFLGLFALLFHVGIGIVFNLYTLL
jgi:hypothetical protein